MARRRRQKAKRKAIQQHQKAHRPSNRLEDAIELAQKGQFVDALPLAETALSAANDAQTMARARQLNAELHFRLAMKTMQPSQQIEHLKQGEQAAADTIQPRFAYHRGLATLALHQYDKAQEELSRAHQLGLEHESLALQLALTQHLNNQQLDYGTLSPDQQETLAFLRALGQGKVDAKQQAAFIAKQPDEYQRRLWQGLLQMHESESTSSLASLESLRSTIPSNLAQSIVDYYIGVAALRRRDHETAIDAWSRVQEQGLKTPWFAENQIYLLRQEIEDLAEQEEWAQIVDRLAGHQMLAESPPLQEHLAYAHYYLGQESARAKNWQIAASHWRQTYELNPSRYGAQNLALAEETLEHWEAAAEAWRNLVRRRPRKENHPDYLDDEQVAIVWKRISDCYGRANIFAEEISCLTKAIEYMPDRLEWRIELVENYLHDDRPEAAENELHRILEINPDHLTALIMLASLYDEQWDSNSMPIWRRALAVDPANLDAQDGLALCYESNTLDGINPLAYLRGRFNKGPLEERIQEGLAELPENALMLVQAGLYHRDEGQDEKARQYLAQAEEAALKSPVRYQRVLGLALHELLHVDGDDEVERLIPQVRSQSTLRMTFWIEQGASVLHCDLGQARADRFWQEAISVAEQQHSSETPAVALAQIVDAIASNAVGSDDPNATQGAVELIQEYLKKAEQIAPERGVEIYAEAVQASLHQEGPEKLKRLFRKAKRQAKKADEKGLVEHIEEIEETFFNNNPMAQLAQMLGGETMPDFSEFMKTFGDLDDDDF